MATKRYRAASVLVVLLTVASIVIDYCRPGSVEAAVIPVSLALWWLLRRRSIQN